MEYSLTYDDSNLPSHYGWKTESQIDELEKAYLTWADTTPRAESNPQRSQRVELENRIRKIIDSLDDQGRWVSRFTGERLVGQLKLPVGTPYLSSAVFSENLEALSDFLVLSKYARDR